jgi:hypothetical protein
MEKTIMGLVAAIGAAAPLGGAHAAVVSTEDAARSLQVSSVAELLEPVSNSAAILAALDSAPRAETASQDKGVEVAQFYHHHHHHHHHYYHHHHHHHYYYHHHHHHHYYHHHHHHCIWSPVGWVCP